MADHIVCAPWDAPFYFSCNYLLYFVSTAYIARIVSFILRFT